MTVKTYPGLFGEFLDWVAEAEKVAAHAVIGEYVALKSLDKDQADWLYSIVRRAVNDGMLSDRWWD